MIQIYTTPSCASCRKAKKWFDQYKIPYSEKNIFSIKLSKDDIFKMLANSENGFEDIISTRSKIFKEKKLDPDSMSVKELVEFIIEYPSVLKRPIIINENELQVGYNNEDITIFLPKELRNIEAFSGFDSDDALNIKYSKNKFKIYSNIIVHYIGEKISFFLYLNCL